MECVCVCVRVRALVILAPLDSGDTLAMCAADLQGQYFTLHEAVQDSRTANVQHKLPHPCQCLSLKSNHLFTLTSKHGVTLCMWWLP